MKILIAEDSSSMRKLLKNCLNRLGISEIVEASDGKQAFHMILQQGDIDLILLDWKMPVMNGMEFIQKFRALPFFNDVPIIMVTSTSDNRSVFNALKAGVNDYIVKPFKMETIELKILPHLIRNSRIENSVV